MPANLSPEYKEAQEASRRARESPEKLESLRVMLRTIPKHKGTEHLQAQIKTRIKELSDEVGGAKKGGAHGGPDLTVRHEGAVQVALVGPPNAGKSSLHTRLTGSHAVVGPYPFSTKLPLPGMLAHEDVQSQLVDLPPVTGAGLGRVDPALFALPGIVRVYSKVPGHPPDRGRPFTLRGGGTVRDVARQVHRGLAAELH